MMQFVTRWAAIAATLGIACAARAGVETRFDNDLEGWRVVTFPYSHIPNPHFNDQCSFDAGNGMPPGSLRIGDVYPDTGISAPSAYLGDQSASYGATLEFDIFIRFSDNAAYPAVVLDAGTYSLFFTTASPPIDTWHHQVVPLLASEGWRFNAHNGPAATEEQLQSALAALEGLYINSEWRDGPDDTNVDNIVLGPPDCPSDFDESGFVDLDDFIAFVQAFEEGTDNADFDESGFVDLDDFIAFVLAFESGC